MDDATADTEVLVVGGGPGGYVAAIRAATHGLETTLVERDGVGGTCLNHGCIPSKALLSGTGIARRAATAEDIGVYADPAIDLASMVEWKDGVVTRLTRGVGALCENAGVEIVEGEATFTGPTEARVARADEDRTVGFEHAVVATGSRPTTLPGFAFDGEDVLSSKHALALEAAPESLVVVGAGYIGMELSTVFQTVGTDVTVLEMLPEALPGFGEDATAVVRERAESLGVAFQFGEAAQEYEPTENGGVVVRTETEQGATATYEGDAVLVAVGREPVTESLSLDAVGIEVGDDGFLDTDEEARTSAEHVFAVGDVAGEPMLAHAAMAEGEVAADVIAGEPAALDHRAVPAAVFTEPEIGAVGMTAEAAEDAGFEPVVGEMPFRASGRAMTLDEREGFVRLVADADDGFVLGARIVGPEAAELIAEVGLAIEMGARLEDIAGTIHTHPTLSEAVREAALAARDEAIHTM